MRFHRLRLAGWLVLLAMLVPTIPVLADEPDEEEEVPAQPQQRVQQPPPPPPPPPPRMPPPPPPPRMQPPPPPPLVIDDSDCEPRGFFLEPEVTIMKFRDTELDFAVVDGDLESIETDYEVGWRLGLGYRWENRWDITARGSVLEADEEAFVDDSSGDLIAILSSVGGSSTDADEAFASLDVDLNTLDLEVGRMWGDENGRWARVFFGPRFATFDREEFVAYAGEDVDTGDDSHFIHRDLEVDMWGVRSGLEGHANLGGCWSFFGWGGISVLVGDFQERHFEEHSGSVLVDFEDDVDETVSVLEAGLGFNWIHEFSEDWAFGLRFGYELQNWTDLLSAGLDESSAHDDDDLGVDGGFLRLIFVW